MEGEIGFYPTYREIARALGSHEFTSSSWRITVGERYRVGNYLGMVLLVSGAWWWRALDRDFVVRAQLGVVAVVALVAAGLVAIAPSLFPHIAHPRVLYPPATTLVRSLLPIAKTSQFSGLRSVFAARPAPLHIQRRHLQRQ